MKLQTKFPVAAIIAAAMATTLVIAPTYAAKAEGASTASELSALPLASIVVAAEAVASAATNAAVALPVALSVTGSTLVIKSVEASVRGTVCMLERVSDGARASVEIAASGVAKTALGVGQTVSVSVIAAGAVLSVAGEVVAFVPNELGRSLLRNERVSS
ncbi:MAG: hypothetical protein ABIZ64_11755 [Casimicrobium sp.]